MGHIKTIGLIGCGRWGINILRDLVSQGCNIIVADPSESARNTALTMGACAAVSDATKLPPVDGIIIASPTSTHIIEIDKVLDRHIPVFVEKPLSDDLAACQRLEDVTPERIFVMEKWRYHPGVEALANIVRSGELGPVKKLSTTRLGWKDIHTDVHYVWILAPHDLSIAMEIMGDIPPLKQVVEEQSIDGMQRITAIFGDQPRFECLLGIGGTEHRREIHLHCEQGGAILNDPYADHILVYHHSAPTAVKRNISQEMPLLKELQAFINYLNGGPRPRSGINESNHSITAITQILQHISVQ